jgi:hypothetical protein
MRITAIHVPADSDPHDPLAPPRERDAGPPIDSAPEEVKVMAGRPVPDDERMRAVTDAVDDGPVRALERDGEAGTDAPEEPAPVRRGRREEREHGGGYSDEDEPAEHALRGNTPSAVARISSILPACRQARKATYDLGSTLMHFYGVVSIETETAFELFPEREQAEAFIAEVQEDEPETTALLRVEAVELAGSLIGPPAGNV